MKTVVAVDKIYVTREAIFWHSATHPPSEVQYFVLRPSPLRGEPPNKPPTPPTHSLQAPPALLFSFEPGISSHHKHESESSQIIVEAAKFLIKVIQMYLEIHISESFTIYLLHTKISVQGPLFG